MYTEAYLTSWESRLVRKTCSISLSSGTGSLRANTSDVCVGVDFPNSVTYSVEVSATPNACQLPQPIRAQIQFIRFGTVTININLQCDCNCDAPVSAGGLRVNRETMHCKKVYYIMITFQLV